MKHHAGARHRSDVSHNERRGALPLDSFQGISPWTSPSSSWTGRSSRLCCRSSSSSRACSRSRRCRSANIPGRGARRVSGRQPQVIAETVATPLEEQISGVEGMMYIKSVAGSDGVLVTTVTFRSGINADDATVRVQNRVAQAQARLPAMWCARASPSKAVPAFLMVVHLTSPDKQYDTLYLRNYARLHVRTVAHRAAQDRQRVVLSPSSRASGVPPSRCRAAH